MYSVGGASHPTSIRKYSSGHYCKNVTVSSHLYSCTNMLSLTCSPVHSSVTQMVFTLVTAEKGQFDSTSLYTTMNKF